MTNELITIRDLTKKFGSELAVDHLNMTVQRGDIYGFVGQNGSGKTTTMKLILSMIEADSGSIALFGKEDPADLQILRERIGSIVESPAFYPYMSAKENMTYYAKFKGITDKKIVEETLEIVGLTNNKKKFKHFSMGMKQRLGLALAIMNHPDLLILDEPLNGLDPQGIAEFRRTLLRLNQELNITIIISSHILDELAHIATNYGFINNGRLVEEISAADLQQKCGKYLLFKLSDVKKASFILEQELQITDYKVLDHHTIKLFDGIDRSQAVVANFVKNQVEVMEVERKGVSLEDYYLNLVTGGAR